MSRGKTAVIVGAQWGDEGKGKIVDVLSENFRVVVRYAGGHNAGHTVIIGGQKFVLQLIPCGVLRAGCKSVIGNGVVLDPMAFLKEVGKLREAGVKVDGSLFISNRAHVILPYHRMIELARAKARGQAAPQFLVGDMLALPFPGGSFDLVTIGYGLRNVPDLGIAIEELARVVRSGEIGRAHV